MGNHGTKRKFEETEEATDSSTSSLHTPKRKRIKSTSKYIYQTLFLNGENSDVTIQALNKEWKLHKHYLCQCGYFSGMFNGNWLESTQSTVEVDILDENVNESCLKIAFGSLYKDDIFFKPVELVGVLAASTFLQLEGLIQHCVDVMKETISSEIVIEYYYACQRYGLVDNKVLIFHWLLHNLMSQSPVSQYCVLKKINCELMSELIASPDLWVLQVEMDAYSLLRKWIFLRTHLTWCGDAKELTKDMDNFFKRSYKENKLCFLELSEGQKYITVFQKIRWQHVINDGPSLSVLQSEKVLPEEWLNPLYKHQWLYRLQTEQNVDKGPKSIDESLFLKECTRSGRRLLNPTEHCWRWIGFNYGVDLLVSFINGVITVKRNCGNNSAGSIGLQETRDIMLRLTAASLDNQGHVKTLKTTGLQSISLTKDEECVLIRMEPETIFPLYITLNALMYTPLPHYATPLLDVRKIPVISFSDVAVQTIGLSDSLHISNDITTQTSDSESD